MLGSWKISIIIEIGGFSMPILLRKCSRLDSAFLAVMMNLRYFYLVNVIAHLGNTMKFGTP